MKMKLVKVLGTPVGNLWDILDNENKFICRVGYEGNSLKVLKGKCSRKDLIEIEQLIDLED